MQFFVNKIHILLKNFLILKSQVFFFFYTPFLVFFLFCQAAQTNTHIVLHLFIVWQAGTLNLSNLFCIVEFSHLVQREKHLCLHLFCQQQNLPLHHQHSLLEGFCKKRKTNLQSQIYFKIIVARTYILQTKLVQISKIYLKVYVKKAYNFVPFILFYVGIVFLK